MPQMAPMLWLILFLYFIILFILYISNFYFVYSPGGTNYPYPSNWVVKSFNWSW